MRFRCESCGAQYAIADEKLGQKGVRVRCKKCGEVITVLPPQPEPEPGAEAGPQPEAAGAAGGGPEPEGERESTAVESAPEGAAAGEADDQSLNLGEDDDLRDALDNILGGEDEGGGLDAGPDEEEDADLDRQATRVFNVEEMQQVQAEREQAQGEDQPEPQPEAGPAAEPPADVDRQRVEWYAAVDEEQVGPMSLDDFADRWQRGEFDSETLVWRSGFEDWLSVFEVAEFAFLAEEGPGADGDEAAAAPEDWTAGADDWAPGMAAHAEPDDEDDRVAEQGLGAAAGGWYGDEDEEEDQDEIEDDFGEEGEASAGASAAAFAGADVEWQPAALSSLSNLAEEELSSLRPEDPEPEEEELPFGSDEQEGSGAEESGGELDDGDSSLIAQIAAEEEAAASQRTEQEQQEEEEAAADAPQREEDESDLEAQAAASREKIEEQRERTAPPEERYIPPRSGLPRWAVGLMVGSGLVVLVLVGLLGYMLARSDTPAEPSSQPLTPPAGQQPQPAAGPGEGGGDALAVADPDKGAQDDSGAAKAGGEDEPGAAEKQTSGSDEGVGEEAEDAAGADEGVDEGEGDGDGGDERLAAASAKPDRDKRRRRRRRPRRRRAPKPKPRPPTRVAAKKPEPRRPEPKKPARRKSKGGVLDFEDPDDRAFAAEAGIAQPKPSKSEPKEKKLPPLSNADVLSVMKQHLAEFKACNRKQKQIDSSVRGKMVINFTIANNGRVSAARISARTAQFKGTYVAKCIQGIIKRLRFPEFGGKPKKVPFPFTVN